jgi:regulator of CtrA degradation
MKIEHSLLDMNNTAGDAGNIVVMPSLFRETMDMIFESYDLFELHDSIDQSYIPSHIQSLASSEMSRVTMRLTSVMAWLMARKAIASGQLEGAVAIEDYKLEGEEYCLGENELLADLLPSYILDLLGRSQTLYERVWRIDRQTRSAQMQLL